MHDRETRATWSLLFDSESPPRALLLLSLSLHALIFLLLSSSLMPVRSLLSLTRRRSSALSSKCINSPRSLKISAFYSVSKALFNLLVLMLS